MGAVYALFAVGFNVKWVKNKGKVLQKVYVTPSWVDFEPPPSIERGSGTPFAENDRLKNAEAIALNMIEGPEDVILDRKDNLYTVNRNGSIIRFFAPDYTVREEFARIGQMLNHGPKGYSGKFSILKSRCQKRFAQNMGAALFGVINCRAGDIDAQGLVGVAEAMF